MSRLFKCIIKKWESTQILFQFCIYSFNVKLFFVTIFRMSWDFNKAMAIVFPGWISQSSGKFILQFLHKILSYSNFPKVSISDIKVEKSWLNFPVNSQKKNYIKLLLDCSDSDNIENNEKNVMDGFLVCSLNLKWRTFLY